MSKALAHRVGRLTNRPSAIVIVAAVSSAGCFGLLAAGQHDRDGQELRRQHRYLDAALAYEQAYLERQQVLGPDHRAVALTMTAAGQCFNLGGKPRKGLELLQRALPIVERTTGAMSDSVAATLYAMADAELKLGMVDTAEAHQRRALEIAQQIGMPPIEFSNFVAQLGRIILAQDRPDEAYRLDIEALTIRRALQPPKPDLVAQSQDDLGVVFQTKGDFPRARDSYAQALATTEVAGEHMSVTYAGYLRDYGAILYEMRDYAGAEAVARRALSLDEQLVAPDSLEVAHSASFLGLVLAKEGRPQDATPFHRHALAIRERELGPRHELALASLVFLARDLQAQGDAAAAEDLWRKYLRTQEARLGPQHAEVGAAAVSLAECLRLNGKDDEADHLFFRGMKIAENGNTTNLLPLALRVSELVDASKQLDAWESLFSDAVAIARQRGIGRELDVAVALEAYGRVLAGRDKCNDADAALDEAIATIEKKIGSSDPRTRELRKRIDTRRCVSPRRTIPDRSK